MTIRPTKIFSADGKLVGVSYSDLNAAPQGEDSQHRTSRGRDTQNAPVDAAVKIPSSEAPAIGASAAAKPIGYRNPPRRACFKPGVSGNPKGRPRGQSLRSVFLQAASAGMDKNFAEFVRADPNSTKLEAAISSLFRKAHYGDANAIRQVLALQREYGSDEAVEEGPEVRTQRANANV